LPSPLYPVCEEKMRQMLVSFLFLAGIFQALPGECRMIDLYIGNRKLTVEVAETPGQQMQGLMFRESIPDNFGMLFIYNDEETRSMWMKNTLVHLDLIFLDRERRVIDMYMNVPPCTCSPCPSYPSRKPAQYVLELKGNRSTELGLKVGDRVFFIL